MPAMNGLCSLILPRPPLPPPLTLLQWFSSPWGLNHALLGGGLGSLHREGCEPLLWFLVIFFSEVPSPIFTQWLFLVTQLPARKVTSSEVSPTTTLSSLRTRALGLPGLHIIIRRISLSVSSPCSQLETDRASSVKTGT